MIDRITKCSIGCSIGALSVNILAYADDIVLLSPSWRGLQPLIDTLSLCAETISMTCNDHKTVCMIVNPRNRSRTVRSSFPLFKLGTYNLCHHFVT